MHARGMHTCDRKRPRSGIPVPPPIQPLAHARSPTHSFAPPPPPPIPTQNEQCAICLTEFSEGNRIKSLPCGHMYHPECIDTWLRNAPKCPLCQQHVMSWNNDTTATVVTDMSTPLGDGEAGEAGGAGGSGGSNANVPGSIFEMTLIGGSGRSGGSAASGGEAAGGGGDGGGAFEQEFMPVPNTRVHANLPSSQIGVESVTLFGSSGLGSSLGAAGVIGTQEEMDEDNPPGQSESQSALMVRAPSQGELGAVEL